MVVQRVVNVHGDHLGALPVVLEHVRQVLPLGGAAHVGPNTFRQAELRVVGHHHVVHGDPRQPLLVRGDGLGVVGGGVAAAVEQLEGLVVPNVQPLGQVAVAAVVGNGRRGGLRRGGRGGSGRRRGGGLRGLLLGGGGALGRGRALPGDRGFAPLAGAPQGQGGGAHHKQPEQHGHRPVHPGALGLLGVPVSFRHERSLLFHVSAGSGGGFIIPAPRGKGKEKPRFFPKSRRFFTGKAKRLVPAPGEKEDFFKIGA